MNEFDATSLDAVVRVIQSSLTPAFLLTAIASLLSVFATRLARISDQVKEVAAACGEDPLTRRRLKTLRFRSRLLDVAVILGALAGACVAGTVLVLFLGLLRAKATVASLFFLFGIALICTIGALTAFMAEVLIASSHIRAIVDNRTEQLEPLP